MPCVFRHQSQNKLKVIFIQGLVDRLASGFFAFGAKNGPAPNALASLAISQCFVLDHGIPPQNFINHKTQSHMGLIGPKKGSILSMQFFHWPSLAVPGRRWPPLAIAGHLWPPLDLKKFFSNICQKTSFKAVLHLAISGRPWPSLACPGHPWPRLAIIILSMTR